jgi:hypothetical protein
MRNVLLWGKTWQSPRARHGLLGCLCLALLSTLAARGQEADSKSDKKAPAQSSTGKASSSPAAKDEADKPAVAPDAGGATGVPADPSKTRKIAPNEVFRDPRAVSLADLAKLRSTVSKPVTQNELLDFKAQAGGANANIDKDLINRVVDAMVAKLTERANVQALVDPPDGLAASAPAFRGVQEATTTLLEPIFQAKSIKNQTFLTTYYRVLREKLTPLLKNHLIPRVQAMVILGQAGIADYLPLYEAQIKDPNQPFWVKLWAIEGMVNVIEEGGRLTAQDQIIAAKTVSDFLNKEDAPWPVQLRAMEALSAMRQGYEANKPQKAAMAHSAMAMLTDGNAKLEVRAEAARALGMMQIANAIPKYNYQLVGHAVGQLAADLGSRIATGWTGNEEKAKYYIAILFGPVFQAFDGVSSARDSGLVHAASGSSAKYIQNVFELVKPVIQAANELRLAGQRQEKDRQKGLLAKVAALKDFLDANSPADHHLVPGEAEFPIALLPDNGLKPGGAAAPVKGNNR